MAKEIKEAVRSMGRLKAQGLDSFQPVFYQQSWEVVGESMTRFVLVSLRLEFCPSLRMMRSYC